MLRNRLFHTAPSSLRFHSSSSSSSSRMTLYSSIITLPLVLSSNFRCSSSASSSSPSHQSPPFAEFLLFSDSAKAFLRQNKLDTIENLLKLSQEEVVQFIGTSVAAAARANSNNQEDDNNRDEMTSTNNNDNKTNSSSSNHLPQLDEFDAQTFDIFNTVCRLPEKDLRNFFFTSAEQGHELALRCIIASGRLVDVEYRRDDHDDENTSTANSSSSNHYPQYYVASSNIDDIKDEESGNRTAMFIACLRGHLDCVKALFQFGADVDEPAKGGWTPLQIACEQGHAEVVELLLKLGARCDIPRTPESGILPIHVVAHQGHAFLVHLLATGGLQKKDPEEVLNSVVMNYKTRETDYITPVMIACQQERVETVATLLEQGADPLISRKSNGYSILMTACELGNHELVEAILNSKRVSDSDKKKLLNDYVTKDEKCTPLCLAAINGKNEVVRSLLTLGEKYGIDKNKPQIDGASPLFCACQLGFAPIVYALLKAKADPNGGNTNLSPLFIAVQEKHYSVVHLLLRTAEETGLDKNQTLHNIHQDGSSDNNTTTTTDTTTTVLSLAVQRNDPQMVELLMDFGVDCEKGTESGVTPLALAVHMGLRGCVKALLKGGASSRDWSMGDFNSLGQLALHKGHSEIFQMITHHEKTGAEKAKEDWITKKKMEKKMYVDEALNFGNKKKS